MGRKFVCFVPWLLGIIVVICLGVFLAFQLSPKPGAWVINQLFAGEVVIKDSTSYNKALSNVQLKEDQIYPSSRKKNTFDLYYPKTSKQAVPVVLWVHGGGYVGGDKSGIKEFATRLVADSSVAFISMNYELAPDAPYPNQLKQVNEVVQFLLEKKQAYPMLDLSKFFIGGDSAGAQIALQYATVQTNANYAKELGMTAAFPANHLKGTLSYCGPVDLKQMANQQSDDRFMKFFVKTVAWSLLGNKDWQKSAELQEVSLVDKVTKEFPPTYLTDGNSFSFQDQGLSLVQRLEALNVPVSSLFFKDKKATITHEYQFDYQTKQAKQCYQETVQFVNKYK
ncbi:alpha/beta hydrolase [Enterococcus mundtii]|uniref:Lipase n=1 Tax=Enterococcus mundtii TaxID=53346 RepID=A0A242KMW5_ENTMU|nr:alpha/beta hydrolase [Enterococcus mundtii]OTP22200.1 lipase [Enterococcus mundtii]